MKNSLWIIFYFLVLILIVFFEYKQNDEISKRMIIKKYEIQVNNALNSLLLEYTEPLDSSFTMNRLWKIVPPKPKKKKKEEKKEKNKIKVVTVTLQEKTLCIEKKCFKLLGIFLDKHYSSSFYVKEAKNKIQTFKVGEMLDASIQLKKIHKNSIFFKDLNSTREWSINLFDINSSKYKPKEF